MPPQPRAGEVLAHVQGASLKANAAVLRRLSSSPVTSPAGDRPSSGWGAAMVVRWVRAVLSRAVTRQPKAPLAQVRRHVDEAVAILRRHQRDGTFRPNADDVAELSRIEHDLFRLAGTARRLVIR